MPTHIPTPLILHNKPPSICQFCLHQNLATRLTCRLKILSVRTCSFTKRKIAELSLNSTQLQLQLWGWDSLIPSYPSHPPTGKVVKWNKTSNTSIEDFKYFNWRVQILSKLSLNSNSTPAQPQLNPPPPPPLGVLTASLRVDLGFKLGNSCVWPHVSIL